MANIQQEIGAFNANDVPEANSGDFKPVPPGWYPAELEEAELKKTNAGTGSYLKLRFCILGDDHGGRKIYTNINMKNPNTTCEEIGRRELAGLCLACGVVAPDDTDELLNIPIQIKVKIEPPKGEYEASNSISAYKSCGNTQAPAKQPPVADAGDVPAAAEKSAPANEKPAPAASSNKAPWDR